MAVQAGGLDCWRLADIALGDRDEVWREIVSATHLPWTLDAVSAGDAPSEGSVVRRRLGDLDLLETRCGPCGGRRLRSDIRRTRGEYVGVLVVRAGREVVTQGDTEIALGTGDVMAWQSTQPIRFDVLEPLRKHTLLVPLARFQEVVRSPDLTTARRLPPTSSRVLFTSYLDRHDARPHAERGLRRRQRRARTARRGTVDPRGAG